MHNCPLCQGHGKDFYNKHNYLFYECENCKSIYMEEELHPTPNAEKKRYKSHINDVENIGYQKFVNPITKAILKDFSTSSQGLDFGAGTGPVISKILEDSNFQIKPYDPFFHNYPELLKEKYDYIACCEVIEHFYKPYQEFGLLKSLLRPNGKIFCMTDLYHDGINFDKWYYKNDSTHVFIYRKETLEWIKTEFNFSKLDINDRLITISL